MPINMLDNTEIKLGEVTRGHDVNIRLTVFDKNNELISSSYIKSDEYKFVKDKELFDINIPLHMSRIDDSLLPEGKYSITITFERNKVGPLFIKELSPTKTEIKVGLDTNDHGVWRSWTNKPDLVYENFRNMLFVGSDKYRILNAIPDFEISLPEISSINKREAELISNKQKYENILKKNSKDLATLNLLNKTIEDLSNITQERNVAQSKTFLILKIDKAIKTTDNLYSNVYIAEEAFLPQEYKDVIVYNEEQQTDKIFQLTTEPKVDDLKFNQQASETGWKSYDALMSNNSGSILPFLSESKSFGIKKLNIDFSNFSNHVYFGQASSKFNNVFKKIKQIQIYEDALNSLNTTQDLLTTSQSYAEKIKVLKDNMTQYEEAVYTVSASWAWPKTSPSGSNYNYSYSSSAVLTWETSQSAVALDYDRNNQFTLLKHVPELMIEEDSSGYLGSLLGVWGDFFDYVKAYIDQARYLYTLDYDWINSIPRELLYAYSQMQSWELFEGYDTEELAPYLLGIEQTSGSVSIKSITEEKWLRLLSTIPYLNKIRGTRRSIDALLNIYGIPPSILSVREYGTSLTSGSDYIEEERNVYVLTFAGGEYLTVPEGAYSQLSGSDFTIEARFNTSASSDMVLFGNDGFSVKLENNGDADISGSIILEISGSNKLYIGSGSDNIPIYNNDWHNVILQRTGSLVYLKAKYFKEDQLFYDYSVSASWTADTSQSFLDSGSLAGNVLYIGANSTAGSFSGSMQEIRLWKMFLQQQELNQHVYDFRSTATTNIYNTKNNLVAHYRLSSNHDLSSNAYVNDFSRIPKWDASASNFSGNQYTNITKKIRTVFPNFTLEPRSDYKIRIGYEHQTGSQDTNSEVVDIYFSPTKHINEDILHDFAMYDFNNAIGSPSDMYEPEYSALENLKYFYFNKFSGNHNLFAYIKFIQNFDKSVFKMMQGLVPERVKVNTGLLISSPILERNKFQWVSSSILNNSFSASIENIVDNEITLTANDNETQKDNSIELSNQAPITANISTLFSQIIPTTGSVVGDINFLETGYEHTVTGSQQYQTTTYYGLAAKKEDGTPVDGYNPVYEQIEFATYVGTLNTEETDYNNAPVRTSESAGTFIRVT